MLEYLALWDFHLSNCLLICSFRLSLARRWASCAIHMFASHRLFWCMSLCSFSWRVPLKRLLYFWGRFPWCIHSFSISWFINIVSYWWIVAPCECNLLFLWVHNSHAMCHIFRCNLLIHKRADRFERIWARCCCWYRLQCFDQNPSMKDVHPIDDWSVINSNKKR